MDSGLIQAQATQAITHLAFYVGWPRATSENVCINDATGLVLYRLAVTAALTGTLTIQFGSSLVTRRH
jgi:hypothetical protein